MVVTRGTAPRARAVVNTHTQTHEHKRTYARARNTRRDERKRLRFFFKESELFCGCISLTATFETFKGQ
jgi:hypothetical protein